MKMTCGSERELTELVEETSNSSGFCLFGDWLGSEHVRGVWNSSTARLFLQREGEGVCETGRRDHSRAVFSFFILKKRTPPPSIHLSLAHCSAFKPHRFFFLHVINWLSYWTRAAGKSRGEWLDHHQPFSLSLIVALLKQKAFLVEEGSLSERHKEKEERKNKSVRHSLASAASARTCQLKKKKRQK